ESDGQAMGLRENPAASPATSADVALACMPMRRTRSPCCARVASGHAAAPPSRVMKLAPFQLIELHSILASQGRVAGYRIASDQSARMLVFCNQSWVSVRWSPDVDCR